MEFFEDLIKKAYGVKSEDGRRFMKSEEISRSFMESPAYEILFEELVTNDKAQLLVWQQRQQLSLQKNGKNRMLR